MPDNDTCEQSTSPAHFCFVCVPVREMVITRDLTHFLMKLCNFIVKPTAPDVELQLEDASFGIVSQNSMSADRGGPDSTSGPSKKEDG